MQSTSDPVTARLIATAAVLWGGPAFETFERALHDQPDEVIGSEAKKQFFRTVQSNWGPSISEWFEENWGGSIFMGTWDLCNDMAHHPVALGWLQPMFRLHRLVAYISSDTPYFFRFQKAALDLHARPQAAALLRSYSRTPMNLAQFEGLSRSLLTHHDSCFEKHAAGLLALPSVDSWPEYLAQQRTGESLVDVLDADAYLQATFPDSKCSQSNRVLLRSNPVLFR